MYAPIDGRIGEARVKVGNLVGPESAGGGTFSELATIQQLDPMGVDIRISSRYLDQTSRLIQQGLPVRLLRPGIQGEQEHPYEGRGYFVDNRIDETTSTFLAKARIPNLTGTLLPGEYVKLKMIVDRIEDAVVVPAPAVAETEAGQVVYVVDDRGKVAIRNVAAAQTYEGLRVITRGLDAGLPVIVEGLQMIRPGITVTTELANLPRPARAEPREAASGVASAVERAKGDGADHRDRLAGRLRAGGAASALAQAERSDRASSGPGPVSE
jgi:membrane fusion protein (multidrug efflux system)